MTHRMIYDSTPPHLLYNIHDEVDHRRRWCAEVHGSAYMKNLVQFDEGEYLARDPGLVTDSSSSDEDEYGDDDSSSYDDSSSD